MSTVFAKLCRLAVAWPKVSLAVTTPMRRTVVCKREAGECPVSIGGRIFPTNLMVFTMHGFDIILGMDWLAKHVLCKHRLCLEASDT